MIRTIIIKTGDGGYAALSARMRHEVTPEAFVSKVKAALEEFRTTDPERYGAALEDGRFPWTRLYTHIPQGLLEKYGVDLTDLGTGWLTVGDSVT